MNSRSRIVRLRTALARHHRVLLRAVPPALTWLATLAVVILVGFGPTLAAALLAIATVAWIWWRCGRATRTIHAGERAAILAVLAITFAASRPVSALALSAAVGLLLIVLAEPFAEPLLRPAMHVERLPGATASPLDRFSEVLYPVSCGGSVLLLPALTEPRLADVAGALALLWLVAGIVLSLWQLRHVRGLGPQRRAKAALDRYQPQYYVYYSGPVEGAYQIRMWLPHLAATGARGALLIRERRFLPGARQLGDLPIVLAESVEPLEYALVDSVGAIFYVNNAPKNVDGTRYPQVRHVHLGHGDSDKPSSYALSTAMFDQIFVAGQVGADRFAQHGVVVPAEKFVLVGRPQVAGLEPARPASPGHRPVVLYAPTWRGTLNDMQLSSLDSGAALVRALLDGGATVIFRPHPFSDRDATSRELVTAIDALLTADPSGGHWTSAQASAGTVFECMNASDALVSDISSVVSDYLFSGKPIALTHRDPADAVRAEYPFAGACTLLDLTTDLADPVAGFLAADSLAEARRQTREYYLGPWPAEGYAEVFVAAASAAIQKSLRS